MPFKCVKRLPKQQMVAHQLGTTAIDIDCTMQGQNTTGTETVTWPTSGGHFYSSLFSKHPLFLVASVCISELASPDYFVFHFQDLSHVQTCAIFS